MLNYRDYSSLETKRSVSASM